MSRPSSRVGRGNLDAVAAKARSTSEGAPPRLWIPRSASGEPPSSSAKPPSSSAKPPSSSAKPPS
ncbi:MAG: hypothetical protein ACMG6S_30785, partial [Byssovorax sp.]